MEIKMKEPFHYVVKARLIRFIQDGKIDFLEINELFEDENPILLKGLTNIWHFLISTNKGVGYVNFVKTCDIDCSCKCI